MAGFYAEYFDGTNYVPCVFKHYTGTTDEQVYQVKYFNGITDVTIGTLPATSSMVDGLWEFEVADNTPLTNYGWTGGNDYKIIGGKLYCIDGKGWYSVSCGYTPAINYNRLEIELNTGWTGTHRLTGWGGGTWIDIGPTTIQLRIGGVWQTQISGTYNNATNVIGINKSGTTIGIVLNGSVVATATGTVANTGALTISLVPGSDVNTTGINFVRYY